MALNASTIKTPKKPSTTPILPKDLYTARVVQVIDLGLQEQRPWMGEAKPDVNKIRVTYEITDQFMLDEGGKELKDKPRWVSENINLYSLDQERATSTQRMIAIDPSGELGGDWAKTLGMACFVQIVHSKPKADGTIYANIGAVNPIPKSMVVGELVNPPTLYDSGNPDKELYNSLPDFIKEMIDKDKTPKATMDSGGVVVSPEVSEGEDEAPY